MKGKISWHRADSTCWPKWLSKSWEILAFLLPTQYSQEIWPSVQKYSEIPLFKMQTTSFKDIYLINTFCIFLSTISRWRGLSWSNIMFAKNFVLPFRHDTLTRFTFHHFIETQLTICNRFCCFPPGSVLVFFEHRAPHTKEITAR